MSSTCKNCGKKFDSLPFKCKFCGELFCTNCRLPEKHNCKEMRKKFEPVKEKYFEEIVKPIRKKKRKYTKRKGVKKKEKSVDFNFKKFSILILGIVLIYIIFKYLI